MSSSDAQLGGPPPVPPRAPAPVGEFAALFSESLRRLWLLAAGIVHDRSLAEDIVQEAALIALEKWEQFTPGTSFAAWMGQMVRFVALNHVRRDKRRRTSAVDPVTIDATAATDPVVRVQEFDAATAGRLMPDQDDFDDDVTRALADVGEVPRACLLLRTLDELSYAEIAELLGIPEGTAMSHVHRTRQFLRSRLGGTPARADDGAAEAAE